MYIFLGGLVVDVRVSFALYGPFIVVLEAAESSSLELRHSYNTETHPAAIPFLKANIKSTAFALLKNCAHKAKSETTHILSFDRKTCYVFLSNESISY